MMPKPILRILLLFILFSPFGHVLMGTAVSRRVLPSPPFPADLPDLSGMAFAMGIDARRDTGA
jgi:hypothetical protein